MDDFKTYMESYCRMVDAHIESIRELLSDHRVRDIGLEFCESKKFRPEQTLNVFKMVSDLYYRENFHSDIIRVFLDPREKHKEGATFLFAFIDFINDNFRDKVYISKQDYRLAKAERELGRIDILIKSEESKHCVIIENKIYNASDMERQLPKYYDYMTERGYKVDAIIYLPLDINKQPNQSTYYNPTLSVDLAGWHTLSTDISAGRYTPVLESNINVVHDEGAMYHVNVDVECIDEVYTMHPENYHFDYPECMRDI